MKKALAIILTVIMSVFALGGCGYYLQWYAGDNPPRSLFYDDYIYNYNRGGIVAVTREKATGITIDRISKDAQGKTTLIIPAYIANYPVTIIGNHGIVGESDFSITSVKCEKLYIPHTVKRVVEEKIVLSRKKNAKRVVILFDSYEGKTGNINLAERKSFLINTLSNLFSIKKEDEERVSVDEILNEYFFMVPQPFYQEYCQWFTDVVLLMIEAGEVSSNIIYEDGTAKNCLYVANLTYRVDEKVYWIDNYNDGEKIVFPEEPIKEGYKFEGWYKEKELINKWDIEEDVYSIEENAETVELYAKFIGKE